MDVAGEVEVEVLHRDDLRHAAARRAALDAEHGPERRLAQACDGPLADVAEPLREADERRGLALPRARRRHAGHADQLAVGAAGEPLGDREVDLRLVAAVGLELLRLEAEALRDLLDRPQDRVLGDLEAALHPVLLRFTRRATTLPEMRRSLLAALLALAVCAPAEAATTVARKGDFELRAFEREGRLCMSLRRSGRYRGQACGRIPRSPHRPVHMFPDIGFNNYVAAVPPSVRVAEVEDRSGRRERHRTLAARGFFARFVLIPAPPVAVFVRFYGADGALLGVDGGQAGYIGFDNETQVLGERDRGVDAHTEPLLWPLPGDPGGLRTIGCIFANSGSGGTGFCDWLTEGGFALSSECRKPDIAAGLVGPGMTGVRLTLGSGAHVTLAPGALPAPFAGRRAIASELPPGEAVREAAAIDAAGEVVGRAVVGTEPAGQPCVGEDQDGDSFGGPLVPVSPPPGAVTVASASGESLLVADQGERRLCAGLGRLRARVCPSPPADSDRPRLHRARPRRGRRAQRRRRARHPAPRSRRRRDRAHHGRPGLHGPVGGRRALLRRHGPRPPRGDRRGGAQRGGDDHRHQRARDPRREVRRRVLAERAGLGVQLVRRTGDPPCLTAFAADLPPTRRYCTDLDPGIPIDGPFFPYSATVTVPCSPRSALVYGRMGDRFATPVVLLDGGRTVRTRRIPLRGEDAFVAFLPDARARGLRSGDRRVALDLPPASSQCGYSADRGF